MSNVLVPIFDPNRDWRQWSITDIYRGPDNPGKWYVPNVEDLIWDRLNGWFVCVEVDLTTYVPRLIPWVTPQRPDEDLTNVDVLLGINVGRTGESMRTLIDRSVVPHRLHVDARCHFYTSRLKYVKYFRGYDVSDQSGDVISQVFDQNGVFVSENVPLEKVAMPDHHNVAILAPVEARTNVKLEDGEVVSIVAYDDDGVARSINTTLVMNTAFIRDRALDRQYVTGIQLESPFLSETNERELLIPINMPIEAIPMMGRVHYNNSSRRLPVDGSRFELSGLQTLIASRKGQLTDLTLHYKLAEDEASIVTQAGGERHISENYFARTVDFENAFAIGLYTFPTWKGPIDGYRLEHYLYNLDRQFLYRVTDQVSLSSNSAAFDPHLYGVKQTMTFQVNMNAIDSKYPAYYHAQVIEISLLRPGDEAGTKWLVGMTPGMDPMYGHNLTAEMEFVEVNNWKLRLANGFPSLEAWLDAVYYRTQPMYNPDIELQAPAPNFFNVVLKDRTIEFPIYEWDQPLTLPNDLDVGETLFLEFIYRLPDNDLQVGVAGLPVTQRQ